MTYVFENSLHTQRKQERLHLFLERVCTKKKMLSVVTQVIHYLQLWV